MKKLTYKTAGVDIASYEKTLHSVKRSIRSTFTPNVVAGLGHFGGFFALRRLPSNPVLVASTDSVGTKVLIAERMKRYDTVGADIVNHCVNDVAVCGAVPLAFLDYYAVGKLRAGAFSGIVRGLAKACRQNDVALIGGETAELPDVYGPGKYDIAGTIIGVVGRGEILDGRKTRAGDVLVGLPSTGLHTNGYTLARAAFFKRKRYSPSSRLPGLRKTLGEELLRVHRSYLAPIRALHKASLLRAAAHITGGGIAGNLIRVIPKPLGAVVGKSSWNVPPLFRRLQEAGGVSDREMFRATNMGIGIVFVVPHRRLDSVLTLLRKMKERPVVMGEVLRGEHEVALE